ncbi:MAG: cell division protein SepF [Bacilli bacterium]|nr:cell division protein SepF [Bacilli bacterium]
MALDKLKKILGGDGVDDELIDNTSSDSMNNEEYYSTSREKYHAENGVAGSKMILLEPRAYSESQQITDYLKARNAVVVNLKRVTPDQAKRIVDFLSGTLYAIGGDLQKLGGGIFLCTPNNVNVEGKISDDREASQKEIKPKEEDEDFNNW